MAAMRRMEGEVNARINWRSRNPTAMASSGPESKLLHLVRLRASQVKGRADRVDLHSKDARAAGETEQRLYALDAWRETPFYSARERAALAWTETVTLISEGHVPDEAFVAVREHFSEQELVNLTLAITTISSWDQVCVSLSPVPGTYERRVSSVSVSSSKAEAAS